jgi:hypothetical protein
MEFCATEGRQPARRRRSPWRKCRIDAATSNKKLPQGRALAPPPGAPELDVFDSVKQWKQRRRPPLDDRNVATAIRNLNLIGWLDLAGSRKLTAVGDGDVDA